MSYLVLSGPARLALYGAYPQEIKKKYLLLKIETILLGLHYYVCILDLRENFTGAQSDSYIPT